MTSGFGHPRRHLDVCASTNDEAFSWIDAGVPPAPHGALVTADRQTAGRGRMGRAWESDASDDLYASLILRPGALAHTPGALALAVGVGIRAGLADACEAQPRFALKWPNDVWLDGKKVAGILCEARWSGQVPTVVVGFGINVGRTSFPAALEGQATSVALAFDSGPGRDAVLMAVLRHLERALSGFFAHGFGAVREEYERNCPVLGASIMIPDGEGRRPARALRLDEDGALIVEHSGAQHRVDQADVWLAP